MTESDVLQIVRAHFESLFPKTCNNCGRQFATLRAYILATKRRGPARSHDADLGEWETTEPLGSQAMANCPCGSTLVLSTDGMVLAQRQALLSWVKSETERRDMGPSDVLEHLRNEIRRQILTTS